MELTSSAGDSPKDSSEPFSPMPSRHENSSFRLRRQRTLHFFFGRRRCAILLCFIVSAIVVIVGTVIGIMADSRNRRDNDGPDKGPAEEGAIGWNASDSMVGPDDAWCRIAAPIDEWSLRCSQEFSTSSSAVEVRLLTYNLFWWNLFRERGGEDGRAGKLIAAAASAPGASAFDFMGFQECEDVERVMNDAGLGATFGTYHNTDMAIAIAYNVVRWEVVTSGSAQVAEDSQAQYYGRRTVMWARFREKATDRMVFFANHHGPLPVNSGGFCGGPATAYNLLRVLSFHAHPGDAILLVGDFNADPTSATVRTLADHMDRAYTGDKFNGVDNMFAACAQISGQGQNLGSGGSDHDALSATFTL